MKTQFSPDRAVSLDQISTRWSTLNDPVQFVLRYAPAIRKYLDALIANPHDAEEVAQDFLVRMLQKGFANANPESGRFRDYLKKAIRNAALTRLRRRKLAIQGNTDLLQFIVADEPTSAPDDVWREDWRHCMLNRVWQALDHHQRRSSGNLCYTVLRLTVDHPDADSEELAARASEVAGHLMRPDAFRKQLSRARRLFAHFLVEEVAQTLQQPTADRIEEELIDLGLMALVRDFLPPNWKTELRPPAGV